MYLARFSYDVLPANRQRALDFIRREVEAATAAGLKARALVPEALRPRLVAVPDGEAAGIPVFRFDLRLRGGPAEETPFFED